MTYMLLIIFLLWPGLGEAAITITDLGAMQQSATLWRVGYARIGSGNMYSYWFYGYPTVTINNNLISLNHDTGAVIGAVAGPAGRIFANMQHPNGLVYIGTSINTDVAGKLASFNFVTGAVVEIADVPTTSGTPKIHGKYSF